MDGGGIGAFIEKFARWGVHLGSIFDGNDIWFSVRIERGNQFFIAAFMKFVARLDGINHCNNAVDDREDCGDKSAIGLAASRSTISKSIFGSMAELGKSWEIEEPAIPLNGMDEAKNRIEPLAVCWIGFPGDNFALACFQHFPSFCDEIRQQVIHDTIVPFPVTMPYGEGWLMKDYSAAQFRRSGARSTNTQYINATPVTAPKMLAASSAE